VAGLAVFKAMADDTCIDQCACKEANVPVSEGYHHDVALSLCND